MAVDWWFSNPSVAPPNPWRASGRALKGAVNMRNIRSRLGFIRLGLPVAALALLVVVVLILGSGPAKQASAHFPHPGMDFSMSVGSQCDSTAGPTTCTFNPGDTFTVNFKLNTFPAALAYDSYDVLVGYTSVDVISASLVQQGAGVWPACGIAVSNFTIPGQFAAACVGTIGPMPSSYIGVLMHVDFQCPSTAASGIIGLVHGGGFTGVFDFAYLEAHGEAEGSFETLTINCGIPVGGMSLDPQLPGSSGGDAGLLAGAIAGAMAVVVITGGVWYARGRWVR